MMNKKIFKVGGVGATLALAMAALSNPAVAGTGAGGNAGLAYGEDAAYCDAAAFDVTKTDALSGEALAGATFGITNDAATAGQLMGLKQYTVDPTVEVDGVSPIVADRIAWQEAFDEALDDAFAATDLGQAWATAKIAVEELDAVKANADEDPTTYTPTGSIIYPQDISGVTAPSVQRSLMQTWVTQDAGGTVVTDDDTDEITSDTRYDSVDAFAIALNERLDAVSAVANDTRLDGTDLAASDDVTAPHVVLASAEEARTQLLNAVIAAGYPDAAYAEDGSITEGAYVVPADTAAAYLAFTTAYDALVAADYPFGIGGATYDVMYEVLGNDGVNAAITIANAAIGATDTAVGAEITAQTDADGKIWVGAFGRTVTEDGTTMDKTCGHLNLVLTETVAPEGYVLPVGEDATTTVTAAVEDALAGGLEVTNTPIDPENERPVDTPETPEFESGI